MSLSKLSLAGNNFNYSRPEFGQWLPGLGREIAILFLQCTLQVLELRSFHFGETIKLVLQVTNDILVQHPKP
jgi:hypothetical protein